METLISPMSSNDWTSVQAIYQEGIETGQATFETAVPTWQIFDAGKRPDCRLVAKSADTVVGWAALSPVSKRPAYAGVAEVSVYVAAVARGQGVGKMLLQALVAASEEAGIWTLTASIFPENEVSIAVHKSCGFQILGRRERIAQHDGVWRDTILMERRSLVVGMDNETYK